MIEIGVETLTDKFELLGSEAFENELKYKAVLAGAGVLQRSIKEALLSKLPKASVQNPKYNDTMADAILFSKPNKTFGNRVVHALGTPASGSGTFRTRFYENTTKKRYQKTFKGKKLKKKRYLGTVGGKFFFRTGLSTGKSPAQQAMISIIENQINSEFNK